MRLVIAEYKIRENELDNSNVKIKRTGTYELFVDHHRVCCRFAPDVNGSYNVFEVATEHTEKPLYTTYDGYLIDAVLDRSKRTFGDYVVGSLSKQLENKFSDNDYVLDMRSIFEKFSISYSTKYAERYNNE